MFTGIIEDIGVVDVLGKQENLYTLSLKAPKVSVGIRLGDSVAVDGVCLTVIKIKKDLLTFDMMKETLDKTTLGAVSKGSRVNLERAMQASSRFGGHMVTGHVDGLSTLRNILRAKNYIECQMTIPKGLKKFIVPKGSVCLNGISLTVGKVAAKQFSVYLIPFTMSETTMADKKAGDVLNIEVDILARYILGEESNRVRRVKS